MKKRSNAKINRKLKRIFEEKDIKSCEVRLYECIGNSWLTWAHRHKRRWYLGQQELLSDFNQVLLSCINCHQKLEIDSKLTEKTFEKLRGEEMLEKIKEGEA
jgi:hypothetical protein